MPGRRRAPRARGEDRLPRSGLRLRGRALRGRPAWASDQRQSACDLAFGTSTGALGFRKFPNPRFDAEKWRKINGALGDLERLPPGDVPYEEAPADPMRNNR